MLGGTLVLARLAGGRDEGTSRAGGAAKAAIHELHRKKEESGRNIASSETMSIKIDKEFSIPGSART